MTDKKVKQLSTNVKDINTDLNSENVKREVIENTPFTVITVDEKSFGSMGDYRITEPKDSVDEVMKELDQKSWNRIIQVCMILMDMNNKDNKLIDKIKKEK
tara:strand:+ start:789 stop:1091 length:303 start_codon:yes stop_codon:yes gene_type:complete